MEQLSRRIPTICRASLRAIYKLVRLIIHFPYLLLARTRMFHFLIPPSTKVGVITFEYDTLKEPRLVLGKRVIGKYCLQSERWFIQPPFRLFVDERRFSIP